MNQIVVLSSKGQLVIPVAMRDALGLKAGDPLEMNIDMAAATITVSTVPSLTELSDRVTGLAKRSGAVPITNVDDYYQVNRSTQA